MVREGRENIEFMGYIKNQDHFRNYIKKVCEESARFLNQDEMLPLGQYVHSAYEFADDFTWEMKKDITVLHENNFWNWIRVKNTLGFAMPSEIDHVTTDIFHETLSLLMGVPGVYSFWNKSDICLYVGVSIDLSTRIAASFTERFRHYCNAVYLRYLPTKTSSDAAVLEAVYIAKHKPVLNRTGKFNDELTLEYEPPEMRDPIPCNVEGEKIHVRIGNNTYETRLDIQNLEPDSLEPFLEDQIKKIMKNKNVDETTATLAAFEAFSPA